MSVSVELQILIGFLGLALLFVPLERFFAYHRQPLLRTGWTTDTIHYVVGCFLGKLTDALSLFVAFRVFRRFLSPDWIGIVAAQPAWLQFIELVLVSDLFAYIAHRLLHHVPWLWRLHTIHHSADQMDWRSSVQN